MKIEDIKDAVIDRVARYQYESTVLVQPDAEFYRAYQSDRALLMAIHGLQNECAKFRFPDEDRPDCWNALQDIVKHWNEP